MGDLTWWDVFWFAAGLIVVWQLLPLFVVCLIYLIVLFGERTERWFRRK